MDYLSQVIKSQRARKSLSVINIFGLSVCISAALLILSMTATACTVSKAVCMREQR